MNALLLIDIQQGFDAPVWGDRNNPHAEKRAADLLKHWRKNNWPIFHIQHISTEVGSPLIGAGASIQECVKPQGNEVVIQKSVNSAFIGTDLENRLHKVGIKDVVICGLTTPHCISTTARMAANLGFNVRLVADATASFTSSANMDWASDAAPLDAQTIHDTALAHLHGEFVTVINSADILET